MTNGEKFKEVFKNTIADVGYDGLTNITKVSIFRNHYVLYFLKGWWNAEYQEPSSSEIPNKAEIPTSSTDKNDLAHNLCDSCTNIGCEFQSGIARTRCAFYMPPHIEPDNCGNYVVQEPTTKNDLAVDCINKAEFIQKLENETMGLQSWQKALIYQVMDDCHSVTLTRKKGKWTEVTDKTGHWIWECDCGCAQRYRTKFCPDCGADMRGEE